MNTYNFTLTSRTPLLMHCDDVEKADELMEWRKAPENKNVSKPGDDRSPAWTWRTYAYSDGKHVAIPRDNLMVCLRTAATRIKIKGNKSFKSESQSGLFIQEDSLKLLLKNGKPISMSDIEAIDGKFSEHKDAVRKLGFDLSVKRATVGQNKHIRVRPMFSEWSLNGTIEILLHEITEEVLKQMFDLAGKYAGLCDWRPSSPKSPGNYGMFNAEIKKAA